MNRSQGVTTGAAIILAAGALLRPNPETSVPTPADRSAVHQVAGPTTSTLSGLNGEGPWIASCQYWAPARVPEDNAKVAPAKISLSLRGSGQKLESHLQVSSVQAKSRCNGSVDPWGIPSKLPDNSSPEITAIIAAVPDPERGHLELDFDRTIDSLMQAASDNGYVGSYFWLPWKSTDDHGGKNTPAGAEERDDSRNEPGLIILKYGGVKEKDTRLSFNRAIYVFLVAATPTTGISGEQLRRAFEYEAYLLSKPNTTLSMRDRSGLNKHPVALPQKRSTQPKRHSHFQQEKPSPREIPPDPQQTNSGEQSAAEMDLLLFNYSGSAASLREGIQAALTDAGDRHPLLSRRTIKTVSVAGATSTELVGTLLNGKFNQTDLRFHSFAENTNVEEAEVTNLFQDEWSSCDKIAFLAEDGTVFGSSASSAFTENSDYKAGGQAGEGENKTQGQILSPCREDKPLVLNFPRDISLLRNATAREGEKTKDQSADSTVSPYLRFSLGDSNAEDSVPHFSSDDTPLSQEAQLMAIGRRLLHSKIRTIAISASNILDSIFLAQFLHRACPDARLVFLGGGDLLIEREIESSQYLGAITLSPYNLIGLDHDYFTPRHMRAFASSESEALYNAASFTFWDRDNPIPWLAGYPLYPSRHVLRPFLWATTVGRDGYYPLGILDQCASYSESTLPDITNPQGASRASTAPCTRFQNGDVPVPFESGVRAYPSLFWFALCILLILLSIGHTAVLLTADFWSPLTRDLAIERSDMPRRRAVYVNIATAMLFCMGFVVAYPLFPVFRASMWSFNATLWAVLALVAVSVSLVATAARTYPYIGLGSEEGETRDQPDRCHNDKEPKPARRKSYYALLHVIACLTLLAVPTLWIIICETDNTIGTNTFAGLFFSYRCLHPETGVSPLVPIVLLLFGWYLWGLCQTLRLRFSVNGRPQLPCRVNASTPYPLYVAEEELSRCETSQSPCLYRNITCLLITREILRRFFLSAGLGLDAVLVIGYTALFLIAAILTHVQSLDHFLWNVGFWPTFYEFLIRALFFPLMVVAVTGWVRVIFIWNSLRRGLLEPLERLPIRFAFTRLKGAAWMTMLRQGGLEEYWRDMARSTEAMRQMLNAKDLSDAIKAKHPSTWGELEKTNDDLGDQIRALRLLIGDKTPKRRREDSSRRKQLRDFLVGDDIPGPMYRDELNLMASIERCYARFCELLLEGLLIPYWDKERTGFVEGEPMEMMPIKAKRGTAEVQDALELHAAPHKGEEENIRLAEEFLAIRYLSVIRAVLINLRYTMIFVSMAFVLAILAWNSYPFRPQSWIDWMFTAVLVILGSGIVWVFAQMYRNPTLSRITDTSANELGKEFYLRLATFGGIPLLTWLASQFPVIGNSLLHFIKPGLEIVK
jgi:hypothetical protein